jgi:hypothetical protein
MAIIRGSQAAPSQLFVPLPNIDPALYQLEPPVHSQPKIIQSTTGRSIVAPAEPSGMCLSIHYISIPHSYVVPALASPNNTLDDSNVILLFLFYLRLMQCLSSLLLLLQFSSNIGRGTVDLRYHMLFCALVQLLRFHLLQHPPKAHRIPVHLAILLILLQKTMLLVPCFATTHQIGRRF